MDTVDVQFRKLSYSVAAPSRRVCARKQRTPDSSDTLQILHDLSGDLRAGELTAVLGPSGAGKTSLLTILAGFRQSGVTGEVLLNGQRRDAAVSRQTARRLRCLIPQEFAMLDVLSVSETLHIAARLKLWRYTPAAQNTEVLNTCTLLGLDGCKNTAVGNLSGGEKKRLSCGVELLSNPPLMFFDEPTSGLDTCSAHQVVSHLRALAHQDHRNIVCSIHQPGSCLFQMFDTVMVLARGGRCVYRGPREDLVSTLARADFHCPPYYNPADFVLEVASGERGDVTPLITMTQDDSENLSHVDISADKPCKLEDNLVACVMPKTASRCCRPVWCGGYKLTSTVADTDVIEEEVACPVSKQFCVLFNRASVTVFRDLHMAKLRFAAHVVVGLMLGLLFYQIGSDAAKLRSNMGCVFFLHMFVFFSNAMPSVLTFPAETAVMLREHLNGWYCVRAYYLARTIADLPLQLFCPTAFLLIAYFMTGQPVVARTFFQVWTVALLLTLVAQSLGLLVGAASNIKMGMFLIPVISIPMLLFSGYFVKISDIPVGFQWLSYLSVFRYSFEATLIALYGFGRGKLPCSEEYCHTRLPSKLLEEMELSEGQFTPSVLALAGYVLLLQLLLYVALRVRVITCK